MAHGSLARGLRRPRAGLDNSGVKNFLLSLWKKILKDAAPLEDAAKQWAKTEGLALVEEIDRELAAKTAPELKAFLNGVLERTFGVVIPGAGEAISQAALDLAVTALARERAKLASGASLRTAVLNAGIEEAVLLLKAALGDTQTAAFVTK